jgi:hypothetical protein
VARAQLTLFAGGLQLLWQIEGRIWVLDTNLPSPVSFGIANLTDFEPVL